MDVSAIRQGLATAVAGVPGVQGFAWQPLAPNPPTFAPVDFEITYHKTFGRVTGLSELLFTCQLLVSRGDTDTGRTALDAFISPTNSASIAAALEANPTLGGACRALVVERVRLVGRLYEVGGVDYLGAQIDVRVWA